MRIETTRTHGLLQAAGLAVLLTLLAPLDARAQQQTIFGSDGKVVGRVVTDSSGATVTYDASGHVVGRSSVGSEGTITVYGADGRAVGTVTAPPTPKSK